MPDGSGVADPGPRADFISHMRELRSRMLVSVIALIAAFFVAYGFSEAIYGFLAKPLIDALPEGQRHLAFTGVIEPFYTYLKAGFVGAVVLASPVILYEFWAFVAPALYKDERRWFLPVVLASVVMFLAGAAFAYLVVFPVAFKYLLAFAGTDVVPMITMGLYFSVATKFLLAFGFVFEMPLVVLVLARLGVVTGGMLASWWRYAIVAAVVIGAIFTPPDVVSQMLLAVPLITLYAVSIGVAYAFGKKK
jgi:sec-independent protein translocase protein TatC